MTNLLERAIKTDDPDIAAKIIFSTPPASKATRSLIIASRKRGRVIASGVPGLLAIGCGPRRVF